LKDFVNTEAKDSSTTIILIGPEGDFTNEEINIAIANNFVPVSMGITRLRTETAGVVAAAILVS
jgi:16S rRNA (uracil1498-N3)-methyltransferase